MPKGKKCPQCSRPTFHAPNTSSADGARSCSACGAKGWLDDDTDSPPGLARTCGSCETPALMTYARVGTVRLDYCNECAAVTVLDEQRSA